jgi:hypothetical protein
VAPASAAVVSRISLRFSSKAASLLFMVLRRLDDCLGMEGEWDRDWRSGTVVWCEVVDE